MPTKLPLIVLGQDQRHLIALADASGQTMIPIFDDPEIAERYRRWWNTTFHASTQVFLIREPGHARAVLELMVVLGKAIYFALNPAPAVGEVHEPCLCYELPDLLDELGVTTGPPALPSSGSATKSENGQS